MFYHPKRFIDSDPLVHGKHVRVCKICGKHFEIVGELDPDDPYLDVCGQCLLSGKIKGD